MRPHPGCARLMTTFAWSVPGWAWALSTSVLGLELVCRWAFPFIPFAHFYFTLYALRLLPGFPLVFEYESCKTYFFQYKWNYVKVKAYVSKDCLFLLFWTLFGSRIQSLVTANKSPKLNLCSSGANSTWLLI